MVLVRRLRSGLAIGVTSVVILAVAAPSALALSPVPDAGTWNVKGGHVYASAQLGNILFLGGTFTKLSAPDGSQSLAVGELAEIDITTGAGIAGWAPIVSCSSCSPVVRALAVSTDGSTLYVGGTFDAVDGVPVMNLAAIDIASGQVITTFAPQVGDLSGFVGTILPSSSLVYFGGFFSTVDGQRRYYAAAVDASGAVDPNWIPLSDGKVRTMTFAADGNTIFIGGHFTKMDGESRQSVARVTTDTGALDPWAIPAGTIVAPQTAWSLVATSTRLFGGFGTLGPNWVAAYALDNGDQGTKVWMRHMRGDVQKVALSNDGSQLFFGGHFGTAIHQQTVCGDIPLHGLALANTSNGNIDCSWVPQLAPYGHNYIGIWGIVVTPTYVWVAGGFTSIGGESHANLARFTL